MPAAGAPYFTAFDLLEFGVGAVVAPDKIEAFASVNGKDDPNFALAVAPLGTDPDHGRYSVSGTVPASYQPGDQVVTWARVTLGGELIPRRIELFVVPDPAQAAAVKLIAAVAQAMAPQAAAPAAGA